MTAIDLRQWLADYPLSPVQVDCTTTVMLKILDGKCKMATAEKHLMAALYQHVKHLPGKIIPVEVHHLIAEAEYALDEDMKAHIYEKRVLAETMISRPVMKTFKREIREKGLFTLATFDDSED